MATLSSLNYRFCPRCNEDALHAAAKCVVCGYEPAKPRGRKGQPPAFTIKQTGRVPSRVHARHDPVTGELSEYRAQGTRD